MSHTSSRGSIIFALYGAIAMIAVIGVSTVNLMRGPVRTMAEVTRHTIAENSIMGSARLALVVAAQQPGDCDGDGMIEPPEWLAAPAGKPAPSGGGLVPPSIGAVLQDPWGNAYGYCAWDNGPIRKNAGCGGSLARRLEGDTNPGNPVLAVLSAGPDKVFQTSCQGRGGGSYIDRGAGGDDLVLAYSFSEAMAMSGGLWNLKPADVNTAIIGKNLSVTDSGGQEQFSFNAASKDLAIGAGGTGRMPNIKTDFIQNLTENGPVEILSDVNTKGKLTVEGVAVLDALETKAASISTAAPDAAAVTVTASGANGVALKASGAKAIEASGLVDMTGHKIVNLALPSDGADAASKTYVDGAIIAASSAGKIICEAFTGSACLGGASSSLNASSLGACKKACETAGSQCCLAAFPLLGNNPNAALSSCTGYTAPSQVTGSRNLLAVLGNISAYCYRQY